jgi:hypothetical protein
VDNFSLDHIERGAVHLSGCNRVYHHKVEEMSKYNSSPVETDGIKFDSRSEARRHNELLLMLRAGEIDALFTHPRFNLQPDFVYNGKHYLGIIYEADFQYMDMKDGKIVVEEVKGFKTKDYMLKRKMFMYQYPEIKFVEVKAL